MSSDTRAHPQTAHDAPDPFPLVIAFLVGLLVGVGAWWLQAPVWLAVPAAFLAFFVALWPWISRPGRLERSKLWPLVERRPLAGYLVVILVLAMLLGGFLWSMGLMG